MDFSTNELATLNIDGSSLGNTGPSSSGYIIRNYAGQIIAASKEHIEKSTNNDA